MFSQKCTDLVESEGVVADAPHADVVQDLSDVAVSALHDPLHGWRRDLQPFLERWGRRVVLGTSENINHCLVLI